MTSWQNKLSKLEFEIQNYLKNSGIEKEIPSKILNYLRDEFFYKNEFINQENLNNFENLLNNSQISGEQQLILNVMLESFKYRDFEGKLSKGNGLIYDTIAYFEPSNQYKNSNFVDFMIEVCIGEENEKLLLEAKKKVTLEAKERDERGGYEFEFE